MVNTFYYYSCYTGDDTKNINVLEIQNFVYKNKEPNDKISKNTGLCVRRVMSEYTPQDIIKLIKSNSKSDLDLFKNLIKQFK